MKRYAENFKKLFAVALSMVMLFSVTIPAQAASVQGTAQDLYYVVYNEKNEVVEEGYIPANENGRYTWSGSITLGNGWYTSFRKPGFSAALMESDSSSKRVDSFSI